jgi:hypothetical protein
MLAKWQHVISLAGVSIAAVGVTSAFFITTENTVENDIGSANCSVVFQGVTDGEIDVNFAQSICGDNLSNESLAQAIDGSDFEFLRDVVFDEEVVLQLSSALEDKAIAEKLFRSANFTSINEFLENALDSGLNPNLLVGTGMERTSLLGVSLSLQNIAASIFLLERGASPYVYMPLWGRETKRAVMLHPLDWISQLTVDEVEKAELVVAFVKAGFSIIDPYEYARSVTLSKNQAQELVTIQEDQARILAHAQRLTSTELGPPPMLCDIIDRSGESQWCELSSAVAGYYYDPKRAGTLNGFRLAKLIGVYDDKMYFIGTHDGDGWGYGAPLGLAIVQRDGSRVEFFFHTGNSAGLGHCSRLRAIVEGEEPGEYLDSDRNARCWRYDRIDREFGTEEFDNAGWSWLME